MLDTSAVVFPGFSLTLLCGNAVITVEGDVPQGSNTHIHN